MPGKKFRNPFPTVDVIIEVGGPEKPPGIVLIKRKNPPEGWALPGGFVNYGESLEQAAVREGGEETSLEIELVGQFHAYSDPLRDPRFHTVSVVFLAKGHGVLRAADDAGEAKVVDPRKIPFALAFDHRKILDDYIAFRKGEKPWTKKREIKRKSIRATTSKR